MNKVSLGGMSSIAQPENSGDYLLRTSGVYAISCRQTGSVYVGASANVHKRMSHHRAELRRGRSIIHKLQDDWSEYGEDSFEFRVLEVVYDDERIVDREQFWIDKIGTINVNPAKSSSVGRRNTALDSERRRSRKIDKALIGELAWLEVEAEWKEAGKAISPPHYAGREECQRIDFEFKAAVKKRVDEILSR